MAERVANLEALSENPDVSDSLADVQTRYDKVRNRARVCSYYFMTKSETQLGYVLITIWFFLVQLKLQYW